MDVQLTDTHIIIHIPLLEESVLANSGKCHIVAKTETWLKTKLSDPCSGDRLITIPPITIISK